MSKLIQLTIRSKVLIFIMILTPFLYIKKSDADCYTVTPLTTINVGNMSVPLSLPVNSTIGYSLGGLVHSFNCDTKGQEWGIKAYGTFVTMIDGRRVYSTNIAGIGYAVGAAGASFPNCSTTDFYVDGTNTGDGNVNNRIICSTTDVIAKNAAITGFIRIRLYKTASKTGSGVVNLSNSVGAFVLRTNGEWRAVESAIRLNPFTITTTGCKVQNNALNIQMGKVLASNFHGVNTWPGDANTKQFSIQLDCNAGTKVALQIDGNVQNATQGLLNLTSGSGSATGVGIQLLYNNAPLQLSKSINTGTTSSDGEYDIPLQARYYQIASNITPGTANGTATFTLTYQ